MKIVRYITLLLVAVLTFASCRNSRDVYNEYIALPNVGWNVDSLAVFHPEMDNLGEHYDVWLQLRNQSFYAYSNLWLFVDIIAPDGKSVRDTIDCQLAMPDGKWIGSGWGSLYSLQIPLMRNVSFNQTGTYTYKFCQAMREQDLEGIHSIGLRIEKSK